MAFSCLLSFSATGARRDLWLGPIAVGPGATPLVAALQRRIGDIRGAIPWVLNVDVLVGHLSVTADRHEMGTAARPGYAHAHRALPVDLLIDRLKVRHLAGHVVEVTHDVQRLIEKAIHVAGTAGAAPATIRTAKFGVGDAALGPGGGSTVEVRHAIARRRPAPVVLLLVGHAEIESVP